MTQTVHLNAHGFGFADVRAAGVGLQSIACGVLLLAACWIAMPRSASAAWILTQEIANSQTDWDAALASGVIGVPDQGALGWEFGFYAVDGSPASFTQLETFSGTAWIPGAGQKSGGSANNPRVGRDAMHPGFDGSLAERWAVRRWTSLADGEVRIFGTAGRTQDGTGDGLTLRFYLNGAELASEALAIPGGSDITLLSFDFAAVLAPGDVLDFAADDNANPFFDNLLFQVQITQDVIIPEPASFALVVLGGLALFVRRRGHARR